MLSSVLIIDKRKELSIKYKKSLDGIDTNIIIARTLKDALVMIQTLEPDMIIISDSIEESLTSFCQKIRALTYNTRPIIVALSKSAEIEDRINVLESGADDFISEPVNIDEFKTRIKAHLRRDIELNLDNKTLLPEQKYVKKALKRVLASENKAVLIVGIENLAEYKDVYTEVASDKLIQTFIAITKSALEENDFLGKFDENNFVIITSKYSAEKLAEFLTLAFDTVIPKFYSEKDSTRGYMMLKGEHYAGMRINFVNLCIGGILDGFDRISSIEVLINKLFEIKKLAKLPSRSNYAFERIKLTANDSIVIDENLKQIYIKESDSSLEYLIRTTLELQGYDTQENLELDSIHQPKIIIIDSGENLINLELLKQIKHMQSFSNTKFIVTSNIHNKTEILDAGADLYLPKPYEISDLVCWVEYFLK